MAEHDCPWRAECLKLTARVLELEQDAEIGARLAKQVLDRWAAVLSSVSAERNRLREEVLRLRGQEVRQ
jgi:hypothetical protein